MTDRRPERPGSSGRGRPRTLVNGTRVTVAFPFSQIKLQEPAEETSELVAVVADLAGIVATLAPGKDTEALHQRALALLARLNGTPRPP